MHKSGRKTSIIIIIIICLKEANLKLNVSKCTFAQTKIRFLGHVVSGEGIQVDPNKIRVVKEYPIPTNLKRLRGFLGLCFYYGSFVKDFSKIVRPLNKLQQKDAPLIWSAECQVAFDILKQALISPSLLAFPNFDQPFYVFTDACIDGLGAILTKIRNGREHVIAYTARTPTNTRGITPSLN